MDRSIQPRFADSNGSGRAPIPAALVHFLALLFFFEVLAQLKVVVRPIPFLISRGASFFFAAGCSVLLYLGLTLGIARRLRVDVADFYVPALLLLVAYCGGAFMQLTVVLLPQTLLGSAIGVTALNGQATAAPVACALHGWNLLAVVTSGLWVAGVLSHLARKYGPAAEQAVLSRLSVATVLGAIACVVLPFPSAAFGCSTLAQWAPNAASAATVPSRTGAVSFSLLWTTLATLAASESRDIAASRGWLSRLAPVLPILVVGVLASRAEAKPLLALTSAVLLAGLVHVIHGWARARSGATDSLPAQRSRDFSAAELSIVLVFFFSGAAALVYQVVFAKGLALTFGSTSHALTIVLATYMAGLALGSWWGGKLAERVTRPVVFYAGAELGIALICAVAPVTLKLTRFIYVQMASGADPAQGWLIGLQLALGALVLIPPTLLMGLTLPMLTRHLIGQRESLGASAGVLYASNTLGAASGAILTGYLIMPALGVTSSLRLAVAINVLVATTALWLGRRAQAQACEWVPRLAVQPEEPVPATNGSPVERVLGTIALVQLTVGGFITFGLETTFVHLLATIAGNSAYAFSLMLFAFLIGLGIGSNASRRWLQVRRDLAFALLLCQALLALSLFLSVPYWDAIPRYFASFGAWPAARAFAARELIRFLACVVVMLPPAIFIGAQFPIAVEAIGRAYSERKVAVLGVASALNTVGNIVGALAVGFLFLPLLGSLATLQTLTVGSLFLAALSLPYTRGLRKHVAIALLVFECVLYLKQPAQFDLSTLASGGNVYFQSQQYGRVVDSAESLDGGLTTVAVSFEQSERPVLTLLTNGKFQGDDSTGGEMKAQSSFALAPLLHTQARERALVIGFGTGTTTKVFQQAGFKRIEVAELSGDILTLADRHFRAVNAGVLHQAAVKAHVTDGRNYLLLDRARYDVISIELSSIWFAGAANLYNREFYQLVRSRLAEGGVLQQWVQLHRLAESDVATIFTTLAEQFPNVWLYFLGKQGILVACEASCQPNRSTLAALESAPALATTLRLFDGHLGEVLKGRVLTPSSLNQLVSDARRRFSTAHEKLIATDDNLVLEYSTPKGNVRSYIESLDQNLRYLNQFKVSDWADSTQLTADDLHRSGEPSHSSPVR